MGADAVLQPSSLARLAVSESLAEPGRDLRAAPRGRGYPDDAICRRRAVRVSIASDHDPLASWLLDNHDHDVQCETPQHSSLTSPMLAFTDATQRSSQPCKDMHKPKTPAHLPQHVTFRTLMKPTCPRAIIVAD